MLWGVVAFGQALLSAKGGMPSIMLGVVRAHSWLPLRQRVLSIAFDSAWTSLSANFAVQNPVHTQGGKDFHKDFTHNFKGHDVWA